jgi:outer membrane protein insertion porin family
VSGLSGSFVGFSYQTNNFLGLGETLTFSTQFGNFERSFLFGFTEPYLFDRPISTGFTISSSRYSFDQSQQASILLGQRVRLDPNIAQDYNQNTTGFTVFLSYPLRRLSFARVGLTYGLRLFRHDHPLFQQRLDTAVSGAPLPVAGRPFGSDGNSLQPHHADDHVQHGG